jgi:hypothetical protein
VQSAAVLAAQGSQLGPSQTWGGCCSAWGVAESAARGSGFVVRVYGVSGAGRRDDDVWVAEASCRGQAWGVEEAMTNYQLLYLLDAIDYMALAKGRTDSDDKILRIACQKIKAAIGGQSATPKVVWETDPKGGFINNGKSSYRLPLTFGPQ